MAEVDRARVREFVQLSASAAAGLKKLSDAELLRLLREHRWAVGRLSSRATPRAIRSELNAAVLRIHGLIHPPTSTAARWGDGLMRLRWSLALSAAVFFGGGLLAFAMVYAEPLLAYSLAPRQLLAQIQSNPWGERGSVMADLGMMFFYWGNNLRAILTALALGVLGGVPSMIPVFANGVILGAVFAATVHEGVAHQLLAWIGPHAVPELGGLVLAGAVGLELGRSWLPPGARLRRAALREAGSALAPYVGVTALMVIAAAPLEGFVAPLPLPLWADGAIALLWLLLLSTLALRVLAQRRVAL